MHDLTTYNSRYDLLNSTLNGRHLFFLFNPCRLSSSSDIYLTCTREFDCEEFIWFNPPMYFILRVNKGMECWSHIIIFTTPAMKIN
jgi:hypothetical protein